VSGDGPPRARLPHTVLDELDASLAGADAELSAAYPGDPGTPQPVHTLYLAADHPLLRDSDPVARISAEAAAALDAHAGDPETLAAATALDPAVVAEVWPRLRAVLAHQPVADLRIDLEDGYGRRDDAVEDRDAAAAGGLLPALLARHGGPRRAGVRVKSLEPATRRRGARSLDLVLAAAAGERGLLPPGFTVTLPKVTSVAQVEAMGRLCDRLEEAHALPPGLLRFEVQVETPQAVLGADGTATVARIVHAARGRCSALHYGTYDYSAVLGVPAAHQAMDHPVADVATSVMQLATAGTGVRVAHGSTNVLPVGDTSAVHAAWALHVRLVTRHLARGVPQGWDLHPAQLVSRHLATMAFYRKGFPAAAARLRAYATHSESGVLDEPATALALAGFLLRGVDCGALDLAEVLYATGLDRRDLHAFAGRGGGLERLNNLPLNELHRELADVCAARRWVHAVAAHRPYSSVDDLLAAADEALAALDEGDVDEALAGHPRIGERPRGASAAEQSGVGDEARRRLQTANEQYERRFGHVYLVRAAGRDGAELLALLRERLGNDPATERRVLRGELGGINRLRLQRLVEEG